MQLLEYETFYFVCLLLVHVRFWYLVVVEVVLLARREWWYSQVTSFAEFFRKR